MAADPAAASPVGVADPVEAVDLTAVDLIIVVTDR